LSPLLILSLQSRPQAVVFITTSTTIIIIIIMVTLFRFERVKARDQTASHFALPSFERCQKPTYLHKIVYKVERLKGK